MKLVSCTTLIASLFLGGAVQAASLDFVAEADDNERGVVDGTVLVFDGLMVQFDSSDFAYFDDLSGGKPAGLGVCKVLSGSDQCNPGNDDNLTSGESVTLSFEKRVDLSGFSFTNADHNDLNSSSFNLAVGVNGGALSDDTFANIVGDVFQNVKSITFAYASSNASQYYINGVTASPVPLPAAAPLLIAGMGALAMVRRRRKAA